MGVSGVGVCVGGWVCTGTHLFTDIQDSLLLSLLAVILDLDFNSTVMVVIVGLQTCCK